jgi:hypothetical protein
MRLDNPYESLYKSIEILAFTGTQTGMTKAQKKVFRSLLLEMKPRVFIHGDCIGADSDAHDITEELGVEIWIRPCTLSNKRAYRKGKLLAEPEDPIVRNHKMVDESHALVACPGQVQPQLRSGTWATIRYSKKQDSLRWTIFPDGTTESPLDV